MLGETLLNSYSIWIWMLNFVQHPWLISLSNSWQHTYGISWVFRINNHTICKKKKKKVQRLCFLSFFCPRFRGENTKLQQQSQVFMWCCEIHPNCGHSGLQFEQTAKVQSFSTSLVSESTILQWSLQPGPRPQACNYLSPPAAWWRYLSLEVVAVVLLLLPSDLSYLPSGFGETGAHVGKSLVRQWNSVYLLIL